MLATDVPGNKLNLPGNPVLYVQPDDGEQLGRMLVALFLNGDERRRIGVRGAEWVQRHFRLEDQIRAIIDCYQKLLLGSPR